MRTADTARPAIRMHVNSTDTSTVSMMFV